MSPKIKSRSYNIWMEAEEHILYEDGNEEYLNCEAPFKLARGIETEEEANEIMASLELTYIGDVA